MSPYHLRLTTFCVLMAASLAITFWSAMRMQRSLQRSFPGDLEQITIVIPGVGAIGTVLLCTLGGLSLLAAMAV